MLLVCIYLGLVLKLLNPFGSYQQSLFAIDYEMHWSFVEMIPFTCLGMFGVRLLLNL